MNVTEFVQERESALATFTSRLFSNSDASENIESRKRRRYTSHNLLPRYRRPSSANVPISELKEERKRLQLRQRCQVEHLQENNSYLHDEINENNNKGVNKNNKKDSKENDVVTNKKVKDKMKQKGHLVRYTRDEALRIRKRKHRLLMRRRGVAQRRQVRREQEMLCGKMQTLCECAKQSLRSKKTKHLMNDNETSCNVENTITSSSAENLNTPEEITQSNSQEERKQCERTEEEPQNVENEEITNQHIVEINEEHKLNMESEPLITEYCVNAQGCGNLHEQKFCALPCISECLEPESELEEREHHEAAEENLLNKQCKLAALTTLWLPSHQHLCSRFHMTQYELSMPSSSVHIRQIKRMNAHVCNNTEHSQSLSDELHTISNNTSRHSECCDTAQGAVTRKHSLSNWCNQEKQLCKVQVMVAERSKRKMHRCVERWASMLTPQEALPHSRSRYYRSRFKRIQESNENIAQSLRRPPASLLADLSHHCIYHVKCNSQVQCVYSHLQVKDIIEMLNIHLECCESSTQSVLNSSFGVAHFTSSACNTKEKNKVEEKQSLEEYSLLVFHGHMNVACPNILCDGDEVIMNNNSNENASSRSECNKSKSKTSKSNLQCDHNVTVRVTPVTLLLFPVRKHDSHVKHGLSEKANNASITEDVNTCTCAQSFLLISPLPIQITHSMSSSFTFTVISLWTPCSVSRCIATLYEWWCAYLAKNDYIDNTSTKALEHKNNNNFSFTKLRQDEAEVAINKKLASKMLHICSRAMSRVYSQIRMPSNNNINIIDNNKNVTRAEKERTYNVQKQKRKTKLNVAETPMSWIVFPSFAHHIHQYHYDGNTYSNDCCTNNRNDHECQKNILPRCVWQVLCISGDALRELVHDLEMINHDNVGSNNVQEEEEELEKEYRSMLHSNWNNRKLKQHHFRTARVLFAQLVRPQYTLQLVNAIYRAQTKPQSLLISEENEEKEESLQKEQLSSKLKRKRKKCNLREHKSENIINLRFRCGVRTIGVIERCDLLHQLGKPAFPLDYGGVDELRAQCATFHNDNIKSSSSKENNMQLSQITEKLKVNKTNNNCKIHLSLFWRTLQCYGTVTNATRRVVVRAARSRFTFPYISSIHNKQTFSTKNIEVNRFSKESVSKNFSGINFIEEQHHHHQSNSLHTSLNYSQAQRGALLLAVKCRSVNYYDTNNTSHDSKEHKTLSVSESLESEEHVEVIEVCRVGVLTSEPFFMRKVGSEVGLVWCCLADPLQMNGYSLSPNENLLELTEKENFEEFTNNKLITWCLCSPSHALKLEHLSRTCTRLASTSYQLDNTHANTFELPSAKRVKTGSSEVIDRKSDNNNFSTQRNITADMSEIVRSQ